MQLHKCVFDRAYSRLPDLKSLAPLPPHRFHFDKVLSCFRQSPFTPHEIENRLWRRPFILHSYHLVLGLGTCPTLMDNLRDTFWCQGNSLVSLAG